MRSLVPSFSRLDALSLPEKKRVNYWALLQEFEQKHRLRGQCTARELAAIIGKLSFA